MGALCQRLVARGRDAICFCVVASACAYGAVTSHAKPGPWESAVAAREAFEAEPAGTHTKAEYSSVMDGFRAIYHGDPGDAHAARAIEQVAELLAEQGRELGDAKSLKDAAGQYEFLAKAYPGGAIAKSALVKAQELRDAVAAPVESVAASPASQSRDVGHPVVATPKTDAGVPTHLSDDDAVAKMGHPVVVPVVAVTPGKHMASVTGIRHWSTATYTRVAIDLGDEVSYQAARVENPDRIFFDLHNARLAQELVGKSFGVTDDGFLTRIRAAQYSNDVTRVVLDVHEVGEYSAFLLPNPYRLIIDIHGKAQKQGAVSKEQGVAKADGSGAQGSDAVAAAPEVVAPVTRQAAPLSSGAVEVSALPPMPVTDGSDAFGLPAKKNVAQAASLVANLGTGSAKVAAVAPPRVVIPAQPTVARPVPNTVTTRAGDNGVEVAAVSQQQGKVEATRRPTSQPIAEGPAPRTQRVAAPVAGEPVAAAAPTADGETSLVRTLGLKIGRIVIDAGHGGHDSGTLGAGGIEEKDVVLDVALRLGKLLHDRLGAEIVYTRADDTFIPLETRTAIANKAQADLFISVHANSSQDPSARGVEVYYLNFTSDPDAMRVASRENAVSTQSVHELSDLVKKITLKDKIDESRELASDVDSSLYTGIEKGNEGLKNRGVKKAPFVVLIGANMPSILAEISFVTNPQDADELRRPEYRERVAESLYNGVARYAGGINGVKPVRATERAAK